jgi:hypothetical protein
MRKKNLSFRGVRSAVEEVVRESAAGLCYKRHNSVVAVLGPTQTYLTFPPSDVTEFETSNFRVSYSGRCH